jgi:hypothetical protein
MIKFFRHIRQRMIKENRASKYLLYAIGEIVLVVIGILIALQINTWNENRKLEQKREDLIANLIVDFRANKIDIKSALEKSTEQISRMNIFYQIIQGDQPEVSIDSLRKVMTGFFGAPEFSPVTTSYDEALSTGNIGSLNNKRLLESINSFNKNTRTFETLFERAQENFFMGSGWELRRHLGAKSLKAIAAGSNSIPGTVHEVLTTQEFKDLMQEDIVAASLETSYLLLRNIDNALKDIEKDAENVLEVLKIDK